MLFCDIGNSYAHFFDGSRIWREELDSFIDRYKDKKVYFINVNENLKELLKKNIKWIDIEKYVRLKSDYKGLGVDRAVLMIAIEDGVGVDAGSAITVDMVENGQHKGGFIMPGFKAIEDSFFKISKRLRIKIDFNIDIKKIPNNTKDAISYGAIKPIILAIKDFSKDKKIFLTGGDGKKLLPFLSNAIYDEKLIFKGMEKVIKEKRC